MITLVLNAAEGRVQFALVQGDTRILCHQELDAPSRGTELLPPAIHEALKALQLAPTDVNRIACVHGPGSFTGLRLVLGFAAAFRRVVGIPVGGINYLHALASSVPNIPGLPARCRVLTHARRDLVHRQDFLRTGPGFVPVSEPEMVSLDVALDGLGSEPALLLGSGYLRNAAALEAQIQGSSLVPLPGMESVSARALAELAAIAVYAHTDLEPLYLRPCDAVDNLPHIAAKRGEKAEEALQRLELLLDRKPGPEVW